ncbi:MAG: DNA-processing protein DprA [Lachnospiraceae bacterium]
MYSRREGIFWLSQIRGITARKVKQQLEYHADIEELIHVEKEDIKEGYGFNKYGIRAWYQAIENRERIIERMQRLEEIGIHFITFEDTQYPERLKHLYDMPYWLYYKGKLPDFSIPTAAIVGSRTCTPYGRQVAEKLGKELAEAEIQIISGMANGIDTAGHTGCLKGGGVTWAVLAGSVDDCYPQNNWQLYQQIQERGGILSEASPGTPCDAFRFPIRNRIISGLSDAVIVVEAQKKSGSLITAELALEQGKEVFAVPGQYGDIQSEGCNQLIRDGAYIVTDIDDIVRILRREPYRAKIMSKSTKKTLANEKKIIYSELSLKPISVDELLDRTNLAIGQLMTLLMEMEFDGLIDQPMKNYYIRKIN